jgi:uncharacterized integral membrane protein
VPGATSAGAGATSAGAGATSARAGGGVGKHPFALNGALNSEFMASSSPKPPSRTRRIGGQPVARLAVGAVALIYAIIFIVLNTGRVRIHFVFFTVTTRLWVGLLVCLVAGALLGQGLAAYRKRTARPPRSS